MSFALAIGTFDGVHLGHRRVIEAAVATGLPVRVLTFHPHPRSVVSGNLVELISTVERRTELLDRIEHAVPPDRQLYYLRTAQGWFFLAVGSFGALLLAIGHVISS